MPATHASEAELVMLYQLLQDAVGALLTAFPGPISERIRSYFTARARQPGAIKQDLLPLVTFIAVDRGGEYARILPAVTAWALYLAASHLFDGVQDGEKVEGINAGIAAMGWATMALGQLEADSDTLSDLLNALGNAAVLGSAAQERERIQGGEWSLSTYLSHVAGKAATIIATGVWIGGRLATDDETTLQTLRELGLALGMAMQLADDCLDLPEDLANGVYTLPILTGLSMTEHPEYSLLQQMLTQSPLTPAQIDLLIAALERMGAMNKCRQMVRAYQSQAAAILELFPGLKPYLASYVV